MLDSCWLFVRESYLAHSDQIYHRLPTVPIYPNLLHLTASVQHIAHFGTPAPLSQRKAY